MLAHECAGNGSRGTSEDQIPGRGRNGRRFGESDRAVDDDVREELRLVPRLVPESEADIEHVDSPGVAVPVVHIEIGAERFWLEEGKGWKRDRSKLVAVFRDGRTR